MSLADYLAKNYLTADGGSDKKQHSGKKRKRKEKHAQSASSHGVTIAEDDYDAVNGWSRSNADDPNNEGGPTLVTGSGSWSNAEFRKARKSNWTAVGGAELASSADQAAADAILASAAAENKARTANDEDDGPMVVDTGTDGDGVGDEGEAYMESGAKAGLQTAAEVTAALERKKAAEERRSREDDPSKTGRGQETIYRDATGRIVNVAMKRAEARRKAEEEERKAAEAKEALKGDVQRLEKENRKRQLDDAKYLNVARYADDVEMNEEMKDKDRWNDPAAQFLTKKKAGTSATGKPLYKGSAAPNRYGIRPGYRWDGVDRSNGFEKEYFAAQNRRQNARDLDYAWQMDE